MDVSFAHGGQVAWPRSSADPEKNPILYRSGHYHFAFTPEERAKLRKFLLDGGMLVFNTGLGSQPFYDSAKRGAGS